jgi:predicted enzyme related to lactoylglutathione lyase
MSSLIRSSRDVILRTEQWEAAQRFYGTVLGLPVSYRGETMLGYDTGAIQLYVEKGSSHGPVFDFLVPDVEAAKRVLVAAGCTVVEEDASLPRCYLRDPFGLVFNLGLKAS